MEEEIKILKYQDLTELLLKHIKIRPTMYLGKANVSSLSSFITGYRFGTGNCTDDYFGENGFIDWYCNKYKVKHPSYTMMPFIDKAKGDEEKALEIYFKYLARYQKEKEGIKHNGSV